MPELRNLRRWVATLVIATAGFFLARWLGGARVEITTGMPADTVFREPISAMVNAGPVPPDFTRALAAHGAGQLADMFAALRAVTSSRELERMARRLLADQVEGSSASLWSLLLARWSEVDPAAMVAFVDGQRGHPALPLMLETAFFAWGAVDAEGAFEAVLSRREDLRHAALRGMAERDPEQAAEWALKMPDAQFALYQVVRAGGLREETLHELLTRAVYDGSRMPLQKEIVARLAGTDPAAAVKVARRAGRIGEDPVANAISEIARHDPQAAIEQWSQLPDSRQQALSSVSLVKAWAAEAPDAAQTWARASLSKPVLDSSLLEIAAAIGGTDPRAGLALVDEVGWGEVGEFYDIIQYENGIAQDSQSHEHATSVAVATTLIRHLATSDPQAAQVYLAAVNDGVRDVLARAAGLSDSEP